MPDIDTTAVSGVEARGYRRGALTTDSWDQYVVPVQDRLISFKGRACTFLTPGRAAVGQKILAIHNATASSVLVNVNRMKVDLMSLAAAAKAPTVATPVIRAHRFTALPTNGSSVGKVALDSSQTSSSSVTVWQDASADNTSSGTTLTVTVPAASCMAQTFSPRMLLVGATASSFYEPVDTVEFFGSETDVTLRALEGIVLFLDQAVVAGNPTTERWIASVDWDEYTRP